MKLKLNKKTIFLTLFIIIVIGIIIAIFMPPYDELRTKNERYPILWKFETKNAITCTPATDEHNLYFICWDGYLYSINKITGKLVWKIGLFDFLFKIFTNIKNYNSPVCVDGKVYIGTYGGYFWWNNYIHCIDLKSDKIQWKTKINAMRYDMSVVEDKIYFASYKQGLICLNKNNGDIIWEKYLPGPVNSKPIIEENKIFISSNNKMLALAIDNGKIKWQFDCKSIIYDSIPLYKNGMIMFGSSDKNFYFLNGDNGEVIKKILDKTEFDSSPAANNRYIVISSYKTVYCLNQQLDIIWQNNNFWLEYVHPII